MAERQILRDTINVGWSEERRFAQRAAALGILALEQMATARAPEQDLAGPGYLKTFGYRFSGFNAFGAPHTGSLSIAREA